jgi:hypothetical protein
MALIDRNTITSLVSQRLHPRERYRCLVIQCQDLSVHSRICEQIIAAEDALAGEICLIDAMDQFDEVGAFSCDRLLESFDATARSHPVVLAGPLHFLDYWSDAACGRFWRHLAAFESGPGVVIVDSFRTHFIFGTFQVVKGIARGDVRCLKSRLESTQDRLA